MIIANLPKALGLNTRKLAVAQGSVTGTGAIATGLSAIDPGGAVCAVANSATAIPTKVASITGMSGGTVNVVVVQLSATANAVDTVGAAVNVIATGH
jgi:hypothetical protein